jgi:hypothetical protein
MQMEGAKRRLPTSPMVEIKEDGVPLIRCGPQAPAVRMSVEELLQLEQECQNVDDGQ